MNHVSTPAILLLKQPPLTSPQPNSTIGEAMAVKPELAVVIEARNYDRDLDMEPFQWVACVAWRCRPWQEFFRIQFESFKNEKWTKAEQETEHQLYKKLMQSSPGPETEFQQKFPKVGNRALRDSLGASCGPAVVQFNLANPETCGRMLEGSLVLCLVLVLIFNPV